MAGRSGLAWPPETSPYNTTKAVIHSYSNDFADWCSDKPTNSFLRRSPERHCVPRTGRPTQSPRNCVRQYAGNACAGLPAPCLGGGSRGCDKGHRRCSGAPGCQSSGGYLGGRKELAGDCSKCARYVPCIWNLWPHFHFSNFNFVHEFFLERSLFGF